MKSKKKTYRTQLAHLFLARNLTLQTFNLQLSTFLFFFLYTSVAASAQLDTAARWNLVVSPHAGFVIPHHKSMAHLIRGIHWGVICMPSAW